MKQYKIGDRIWYAHFEKHSSVTQKCPVCFGNLAVVLILGDDSHIKLPCNYCGHGYEDPSGVVTEYERISAVKKKTISRIDSQNINGVETREYFSDEISRDSNNGKYHSYVQCLDIDKIFYTEIGAKSKCKELIEKDEEYEFGRAERLKENNHKSYAWNAGYHMRIVRKAKKDIEWHTKKAEICKARAKK